ncbi:hypothetical protein IAD21_04548 [Abditibacteriota bacterium]|nr:hypothetical protein IAD21_04548 [Abditibacteriota bacterium]
MAELYGALKLYSQDYEGRLPASSLSGRVTAGKNQPFGWAQACAFTYSNYTMLCCSTATSDVSGDAAARGFVSYWINGNMSGRKLSLALLPVKTLLVGEGDDGVDLSNAAYAKTRFSASWLTNHSKPPFRHAGGANYLFVDGHIAWLRPNVVEHFGGRSDPFAFR